MRFELFLTDLPKAPAHKVQAALAELPKGASTGTILKSIEARKVPTVSVAWSEDKRVLNEVMDTLIDLGAGVKLVDHGSLVQKIATFAAEKAGRARYLEDEDDPDGRKFIKLGQRKKRGPSIGEAMTRHVMIYFLQLCVTGILFIWFFALRVGMERAFSMPSLWTELLACAFGLLVTYVCTSSVRAMQAGQQTLPRILPQLILGGALTIGSLFLLGDGVDGKQVADGKVKRPPSLPYSGLMSELRRRKLATEATGRDGEEAESEQGDEQAARAQEDEDALWCEKPEPVEAPACQGGRAWAEALACLPKPELTKPQAKRRKIAKQKTVVSEEELYLPEEPTAAAAAPVAARPWGVTLQLTTVLALCGMWLLSLLGLFLQLRPRSILLARGTARFDAAEQKPVEEEEETFAASAGSSAQAAPLPDLAALRQERDALRAQLDEALTALVTGQVEARVPDGAASAEPIDVQIATLQRDLGLARGALGANQHAITELRRELTQAAMRESALQVELSDLRLELGQEAELPEPARAPFDARAENDGGGRNTGLTRQLAPADDSSYSVNQVQEERVVLGKRQRP